MKIAKNTDNFCVECGEKKDIEIGKYAVIKKEWSVFNIPMLTFDKKVIFTCKDCLNNVRSE